MDKASLSRFMADNKISYVAISALLLGLLLTAVALFGLHEIHYWQQHGVQTRGLVLDKTIGVKCQTGTGPRSCSHVYNLSYQYQADGLGVYKGSDSMNEDEWKALKQGGEVTLLYSAIAAHKSTVAYALHLNTQGQLWLAVLGTGLALGLFGGVLLIQQYRHWHTAESLSR